MEFSDLKPGDTFRLPGFPKGVWTASNCRKDGKRLALCDGDGVDGWFEESKEVEPINMPEIVCLCGSGRFWAAFERAEFDETLAGRIVLTIGCNTHDVSRSEELRQHKPALDELHLRKIDMADRVHVLNVDGYIGESTGREIAYATKHGKAITYLEPVTQVDGCSMSDDDFDYAAKNAAAIVYKAVVDAMNGLAKAYEYADRQFEGHAHSTVINPYEAMRAALDEADRQDERANLPPIEVALERIRRDIYPERWR